MITSFGGALVLTIASLLLHLGRPGFRLLVFAVAIYLVAVVITVAVNVPLNDAIKAAGDANTMADPALVRQQFHAQQWIAGNLVRCVASLGALALLCQTLLRQVHVAG